MLNIEHNTIEWDYARLGRFTTSSFSNILAGKNTASYKNYIIEIADARHTGIIRKSFSNKWTEQGHENEPIARKLYESLKWQKVKKGGFWILGDWVGSSPDGLVGKPGLIEIKCVKNTTYDKYVKDDKLPTEYTAQVQGQLFVTGRKWCDFVVYCKGYPLFIKRIKSDLEYHERLKIALEEAEKDVKKQLIVLSNLKQAM